MKRVIQKYDHLFIKNGERVSCTCITIPYSELPEDCNLLDYNVHIVNVLYDDCSIQISGFDQNHNKIKIEVPETLKFFLYKAREQGQEASYELLAKFNYETGCIKFHKEIGYDNTIA